MEVMIAIFILTIGLVALSALYAQAVNTMHWSQERLIAKQKAREVLESIYTARNTQQIQFDMIQNESSGGIFLDDFQEMRQAGDDGLLGTTDDGAVEELRQPGPDGIMGNSDDVFRSLGGMSREIIIDPVIQPDGNVNPDLRQITVNIQFPVTGGQVLTYSVGSLISRFR
jgi:hypothetical protein